ncbi:MAG: hypothetical protein AAGB12_01790 [Pseudomonadota bacterium]
MKILLVLIVFCCTSPAWGKTFIVKSVRNNQHKLCNDLAAQLEAIHQAGRFGQRHRFRPQDKPFSSPQWQTEPNDLGVQLILQARTFQSYKTAEQWRDIIKEYQSYSQQQFLTQSTVLNANNHDDDEKIIQWTVYGSWMKNYFYVSYVVNDENNIDASFNGINDGAKAMTGEILLYEGKAFSLDQYSATEIQLNEHLKSGWSASKLVFRTKICDMMIQR